MEKMNVYEVRPRGEFMAEGRLVYEVSPELAMRQLGLGVDCIVIEHDPRPNNRDWSVMPVHGGISTTPAITIGQETTLIHPYDRDPQKRLALAKACETICQDGEENSSLEYADFYNQLKKYEKTHEEYKKECIKNRKEHKAEACIAAAECKKECLIAEAATIAGKKGEAGSAMFHADSLWQKAKTLAEASHAPEDTKPNAADRAAIKAKEQFDRTAKKNKEFRNKAMLANQDEGMGAA